MKKVILLLLIYAAIFQQTAHGLSLPHASRLLLESNQDMKIGQTQTQIIRTQIAETRSTWHPSLNLFGNYQYQSEVQTLDIALPLPIGTRSMALGDNDRIDLGVDVSVPIFTGFSRYSLLKAKHLEFIAAQENQKALESRLLYQLGFLYFSWGLSFRRMELQQTLCDQLADYARQVENQWKAGTTTSAKYTEAQARLYSAQSDLLSFKNSRDSLGFELANMIQTKDTLLVPESYSMAIDSSDFALVFSENRPEIRSLDKMLEQLALQRSVLSGKMLPQVMASAGYRYSNPGLNSSADEFMGYGIAGVGFSWNLYDGFKTIFQRRQVLLNREIVQLQRQKQIELFEKNLQVAKRKLLQAQDQLAASKLSLAASQAFAVDMKNALSAGSATTLEYLTALTAEKQAQFSVEVSNFMLNTAILTLRYMSGKEIKY